VKGPGHIGRKATIKALYEDKKSELEISVIPEPAITGALRDIRYSAKETEKISNFIDDEGVIEIYSKASTSQKIHEDEKFQK